MNHQKKTQNISSKDDKMNVPFNILAYFLPIAGFVIYFVNKKKNPVMSRYIGLFSLMGAAIFGVLITVFLVFVGLNGGVIKSNNYNVVTFDGGNVKGYEYEIYYKLFYSILKVYEYEEYDIEKMIANKAGSDKIMIEIAKSKGIELTKYDIEKVDETINDSTKKENFKKLGIDIDKLREIYLNDCIINTYMNNVKENAPDNTKNVDEYVNEHVYNISTNKNMKINEKNLDKILEKMKK